MAMKRKMRKRLLQMEEPLMQASGLADALLAMSTERDSPEADAAYWIARSLGDKLAEVRKQWSKAFDLTKGAAA
jgi:hypothetical protein